MSQYVFRQAANAQKTALRADNRNLADPVFQSVTHLVNMDCVQCSGLPTAQMTALHLDLSDPRERPQHSYGWDCDANQVSPS